MSWSRFVWNVISEAWPRRWMCVLLFKQSISGFFFFFFFWQVKCGSPMVKALEKEKSYGLPSYVVYTVSLSDPRVSSQGTLSTTLTVSSPMTDQSITIPITVIYLTDRTSAPVRRKLISRLYMCQNKPIIYINV